MHPPSQAPGSWTGPKITPPADRRPGVPAPSSPTLADFARRMVVAVLVSVLILALAYLLWRGVNVLLQAFAGVLFAVFLAALSDQLSRGTGMRYGWALAVVFTGLVVILGTTGWLLANQLSIQISQLMETLPRSLETVRDYLGRYVWGHLLLEHMPLAANTLTQVDQFTQVTGLISGVASFVMAVIVMLFVGIFGAAEPELYKEGLLHLVPPQQRPRARESLDVLVFNLRWWLIGQTLLMVIMGATTALGLWLLGIPLALTLGIIAGIFEMVPYIGPWLSALPAALIALLVSPWHLMMVLMLFLALHILEGYVLLPLVQRRAVHQPPALTLVAQVLLGELLGIMGLFVAAPLTVCAVVLLKMLYVEDTLGDQTIDVPGEAGNEEKAVVRTG